MGYLLCEFELLLQVGPVSQSLTVAKTPLLLPRVAVVSPALTKWIKRGPSESFLALVLASSIPSANCVRIWSLCHQKLPSANLERHEERTCSKLAVPPQSVQLGLSTSPQVWRFDGVGRTSYTEHNRNLIRWPSMLQMSCQVRAFSLTLSHLVQLPCLFMATALTCRFSSSAF